MDDAVQSAEVAAAAWVASFGASVDALRAERGLPALAVLSVDAIGPASPSAALGDGGDLIGGGSVEVAGTAGGGPEAVRSYTWRDGAARFGIVVTERMRAIAIGGEDGQGSMWGVCVALFGTPSARRPGKGGARATPAVATVGWGDERARREGGAADPIALLTGLKGV